MSLHISPIHFNNTSFKKKTSSDVDKKDDVITSEITDEQIVDNFVKDTTEPRKENKISKDNSIEKSTKVQDKAESKADKKPVKNFVNNTISTWQKFLKFKTRAIEYSKGLASGTVAGLGIGGTILSIDWAMKGVARVTNKETKATMFITEPTKLVTSSFAKVFKGIYHLPNLTIKEILINTIHSPIDLFKYVKNAKNVSRIGKVLAPLAGGAALAYSLTKSVLRANQKVANIEHAFNSGHAHDLQ